MTPPRKPKTKKSLLTMLREIKSHLELIELRTEQCIRGQMKIKEHF